MEQLLNLNFRQKKDRLLCVGCTASSCSSWSLQKFHPNRLFIHLIQSALSNCQGHYLSKPSALGCATLTQAHFLFWSWHHWKHLVSLHLWNSFYLKSSPMSCFHRPYYVENFETRLRSPATDCLWLNVGCRTRYSLICCCFLTFFPNPCLYRAAKSFFHALKNLPFAQNWDEVEQEGGKEASRSQSYHYRSLVSLIIVFIY